VLAPSPPRRPPFRRCRPLDAPESGNADAGVGVAVAPRRCRRALLQLPQLLLLQRLRFRHSAGRLQPRPSAVPCALCDGGAANSAAARCAAPARLPRPSPPAVYRLRPARPRWQSRRSSFLPANDPRSPQPVAAAAGGGADAGVGVVCRQVRRTARRGHPPPHPPGSRLQSTARRVRAQSRPVRAAADRLMDAPRSRRRALNHSRSGAAPVAGGRRSPPLIAVREPTLASATNRGKRRRGLLGQKGESGRPSSGAQSHDQFSVGCVRGSRTTAGDRRGVSWSPSRSRSDGAIQDRSRTSEDLNEVAAFGRFGVGLRSDIAITHTCRASACSIHLNGIIFPIVAAPRRNGSPAPDCGVNLVRPFRTACDDPHRAEKILLGAPSDAALSQCNRRFRGHRRFATLKERRQAAAIKNNGGKP